MATDDASNELLGSGDGTGENHVFVEDGGYAPEHGTCEFDGTIYPNGAELMTAEGLKKTCRDGMWVAGHVPMEDEAP